MYIALVLGLISLDSVQCMLVSQRKVSVNYI